MFVLSSCFSTEYRSVVLVIGDRTHGSSRILNVVSAYCSDQEVADLLWGLCGSGRKTRGAIIVNITVILGV